MTMLLRSTYGKMVPILTMTVLVLLLVDYLNDSILSKIIRLSNLKTSLKATGSLNQFSEGFEI